MQCRGFTAGELEHRAVVGRNAQQPEAHDQHAGDGAAAEGDLQRVVQSNARGLRRTHIRAYRDVHADVTGNTGEDGAHGEAAGSRPVQRKTQNHQKHDACDGNRRVLSVQVSRCARLNGGRNFLHLGVTRRLRNDPSRHEQAIDDGHNARADRER